MDVLVGYATAHGSTRGIAERIGTDLFTAGLRCDVRPLEAVGNAEEYTAFVLGSAVHGQAWLDPAQEFLRRNRALLAARPVWLFSAGMPAALRGPWRRMAAQEEPVILAGLTALPSVRGHRLLSGVLRREHLPVAGRVGFRLMGGRYGDFRDWDAIDSWAAGIAVELVPQT
ncbi:flavodoxin [Streptomyces sp. A7024]|uniref:Flavodoxin n=1 Tax=Streptomyces coryli TaxID=1128680 RepID=A0A6G4TRI0_9ACTN|nr:flavodoxin domain-containing protein [Streptomyces coryli]NGN62454.1 flavodoxin [Streptomyces coryli]